MSQCVSALGANCAGKHACNQCQARENMHATSVKRGKTRNKCQARENMEQVPNAGNNGHAYGTKRGKTCNKGQ